MYYLASDYYDLVKSKNQAFFYVRLFIVKCQLSLPVATTRIAGYGLQNLICLIVYSVTDIPHRRLLNFK